ncbi:hypothetical protein CEXT_501991 [Caerostris extrusa]|uniref:Uncharacterized protein n=1 Tax=Caerostris extrusa TaxID=172846 RepID=A0AAV4MR44_CAEEX|nr:hypothetical protein CEXT_501991 [Caerostris extrusa]
MGHTGTKTKCHKKWTKERHELSPHYKMISPRLQGRHKSGRFIKGHYNHELKKRQGLAESGRNWGKLANKHNGECGLKPWSAGITGHKRR